MPQNSGRNQHLLPASSMWGLAPGTRQHHFYQLRTMPDFGSLAKGGWHPKGKDGGKESWRGDFKGVDQIAGWMGKGPRKTDDKGGEHISRPLATLKDPSAFGPPPKNVNYHGGAALPNQITPDRSGLGAPLTPKEIQNHREKEQEQARIEEEEKPRIPTGPFRADTTGLQTSHLPPPPGRKDGADGRGPALVELNYSNFDEIVLKSGRPTLVDFYAPYCRYCKDLDPIYEQLALNFENHTSIMTIAKLDADAHKRLGTQYGIQGYPTIKYFDGRSGIPEEYSGPRDVKSMSDFITSKTGALPSRKSSARQPARAIEPPPVAQTPSAAKTKPSLPPRLPPRQNSNPGPSAPSPPPTYGAATKEPASAHGMTNQSALSRLGAAGVSVPGLGIGGKREILPPPMPSRTSTASPKRQPAESPQPQPPIFERSDSPQLSELQSRFSKLGKSSTSAEAPAQGTTFAQKQAALKTAQSFRNDPSSVSLSDARVAASTANNFRERHGDQVASGWKSANKLNSKYGLADKVSQYGGPAVGIKQAQASEPEREPDSPAIVMQDNTKPFKKAPPPPPKKKPALAAPAVAADTGAEPPPVPLSSKPKPATHSSERQDLDLELQSLWFAKTPPDFPPPSITRLPGSRGYSSLSGRSSSGGRITHTFTGVVRHNDNLSTTKIHLTWDGSNPGLTVKAQQIQIAPPRILNSGELDSYRRHYSDHVARWCEERKGTQVGNGECWTLAAEALRAVAAEERSRGKEPCMTSQGVVHGFAVYTWVPPRPQDPIGGVEGAGVARGDIAQFLSAHFKSKNGMSESWAGAPDHTAVITGVERGGILRVVESNVGGVKTVKEGRYDFSELVGGEIRIFRAVGESWVGPLDATWP